MSSALRDAFARCKKENRNALVTYIPAGFPSIDDTIPILKGFQEGGADIIELGIPFSDPIADGPVIQAASVISLNNGMTVKKTLELVKEARDAGVVTPIVLMGYYNPVLQYGEQKFTNEAKEAGANGFIIVDLPPGEACYFRSLCTAVGMSFVPLVAPSTKSERLKFFDEIADSFLYVVSKMGTTGTSKLIDKGLQDLVTRVRSFTGKPIAVGFGISTREHFETVGKIADGIVIGSKIVVSIEESEKEKRGEAAKAYCQYILNNRKVSVIPYPPTEENKQSGAQLEFEEFHKYPPNFGEFGGQYVPEAFYACLHELETAFEEAVADDKFWEDFRSLYQYIGRPSSFHKADRLTEHVGGAQIWLKREDLNHTGSHKINNALAQVLVAKRLGKSQVIAETGAGQHGVATATACAKFGLKCTVYMGAEDVRRQALNVFKMKLLGADVVSVTNGTMTLRDATSEAFRNWIENLSTTHYVVGSAIGPHPYPTLVRTFQSVIGKEAKEQFKAFNDGKLPDAIVACVGGGSNSSGIFSPFENDKSVKLVGVEAAGDGLDTEYHSATLTAGKPGLSLIHI